MNSEFLLIDRSCKEKVSVIVGPVVQGLSHKLHESRALVWLVHHHIPVSATLMDTWRAFSTCWVNGWMDEGMEEWMKGWRDGWING